MAQDTSDFISNYDIQRGNPILLGPFWEPKGTTKEKEWRKKTKRDPIISAMTF